MKVGFTGTRDGMTREQKRRLVIQLVTFNPSEVHHGDCVGSDSEFDTIAGVALGLRTVAHPPLNTSLRAWSMASEIRESKDYLARDRDIVDETDCLIATPKTDTEELRSGTWYTINYARQQGKRVFLILPDGKMETM